MDVGPAVAGLEGPRSPSRGALGWGGAMFPTVGRGLPRGLSASPGGAGQGEGIRSAVRWERVQGLVLRGGQRWGRAAAGGQDGGGGPGAAPSAGGVWPRGQEGAPVTLSAGQLSGKVRGSLVGTLVGTLWMRTF